MVKHMAPGADMWADDPPADGIVIPVNNRLVYGKGVAKDFAVRFKNVADHAKVTAQLGLLLPLDAGRIQLQVRDPDANLRFFLATTKADWRNPSKLEWVRGILGDLIKECVEFGVKAVKVPALGCGLGGLDWSTVKAMCEQYLEQSPTTFYLYPPK